MYKMPYNPEIRELVDVESLIDVTKTATWQGCKRAAIRQCKENKMIKCIIFTVIRANGIVQLVRVGPRGGRKVLHTFGMYTPS